VYVVVSEQVNNNRCVRDNAGVFTTCSINTRRNKDK
jgi:hypothetical protein